METSAPLKNELRRAGRGRRRCRGGASLKVRIRGKIFARFRLSPVRNSQIPKPPFSVSVRLLFRLDLPICIFWPVFADALCTPPRNFYLVCKIIFRTDSLQKHGVILRLIDKKPPNSCTLQLLPTHLDPPSATTSRSTMNKFSLFTS